MSGLSCPEREGCRKLLGLLDTDEIMALCDTVTNRLVQPEDRQDAIRAILVYSQSVEELLRRKKVHRDVIFKYLASQGVVIPPATEKHNLIQHAKDHWKKQLHLKLKETPERVNTSQDIRDFKQLNPQEKEDKTEKVDFRRLGEAFCRWFFELLNSQNPFFGPPQDVWGPQHFWHDVKLRFYYNTSEQNVTYYHGAEIVSLRLLSLVKEEHLFLSPNLDSHGLKCASSPHGLVMVGVAGTVHRGNSCLGIFEQIFGLIRCPFGENTWKIKFVNLRIIGQSSLAPEALMKPAITFEPSDLEAFYNVIVVCGANEVQSNVRQTDSRTGDQGLCSGNEALLNKR
uniref:Chromosome 3 open reading frame 38 n=1 Tax=Myotis lucifugus TaxID=59463 RepID=G1P2C6_MYOLU